MLNMKQSNQRFQSYSLWDKRYACYEKLKNALGLVQFSSQHPLLWPITQLHWPLRRLHIFIMQCTAHVHRTHCTQACTGGRRLCVLTIHFMYNLFTNFCAPSIMSSRMRFFSLLLFVHVINSVQTAILFFSILFYFFLCGKAVHLLCSVHQYHRFSV